MKQSHVFCYLLLTLIEVVKYDSLMINVPFLWEFTYCVASRELPTTATAPTVLTGWSKAEQPLINFKTKATYLCGVWQGKAQLCIINFKTRFTNMVLGEVKPSYIYAVLQLECTCEVGTSYSIKKPHFSVSPPLQCWSQAVVCVSLLGCTQAAGTS